MKRSLLTFTVFFSFLLAPAAAQGQKPPNPPKPPAPSTPPTREPTTIPRDNRPSYENQRPIYISGKVVLGDGSPVPNGVRVEMVMSGQVKRQEFTRTDGSFTFDLSRSSRNSLTDASVSGGDDEIFGRRGGMDGRGGDSNMQLGRVDLSGWEVRASLPGYVSEIIILQNRSALDNPDIGTIVLRPIGQVKATTVSLNSLKAPKKAQKSFESARKALARKTPDYGKAEKELGQAINEYSEYSAAWQMLGEIRLHEKNLPAAREAFQKAMSTDGNYISPYLSLASMEIGEGHWAEAARITQQLLELNPFVMSGQLLNAVANFNLGKYEVAEQSAREIQKSEEAKNFPISHYILGAVFAGRGDFKSAASEFQVFLKVQPEHQYAPTIRKSLSEWQQKGLIGPISDASPAAASVASSK